jgi:hypothetical protein
MSFQVIDASPLVRPYFRWLYDQVVYFNDPQGMQSYWQVCARMQDMTFLDLVEHDSNRIAEATNLRDRFLATLADVTPHDRNDLLFPDASIFEVLVALAERANYMVEMDMYKWFNIFLRNLGLDRYSDGYCLLHLTGNIDRILNRFNRRSYRANGHNGGLFPLEHPTRDQREVELWYQMGAYINENTARLEQGGR